MRDTFRMSRPTLEEGIRAIEGIMAKYVEQGWKTGGNAEVLDEVEKRWFPFLLGGIRQRLLEDLIELASIERERKEKESDGKATDGQ